MIFEIFDDYVIRNYKPKTKKAILIRCLEPYYLKTKIPYQINYLQDYKDVLELYFDDVIENSNNRFVLFNEKIYENLKIFINKNDTEEIIVHCNQGISRSPAVMILIANLLNKEEIRNNIQSDNYFNPNKKVLEYLNY